MPMEGRGPGLRQMSEEETSMVIDENLVTPDVAAAYCCKVEELQNSLHAKAKVEPNYRFYSLWDKIYRSDVLFVAYQQCKRNGGSHGIDQQSFEVIDSIGKEIWLGQLQQELEKGLYQAQPLRRVWIPKGNSKNKLRPLSIACIKDRVVQTAMLLILQPIFEADMLPEQYGFRRGVDAKMAVRQVYFHITQRGCTEIIDADLKDYFTSIPHGPLMKCLSRRICDGKVLRLIKHWLEVPIEEKTKKGIRRSFEARKRHCGVAQGSPLSPLLSNCYFRRFLLAWKCFGIEGKVKAKVVNYADDYVICCPPRKAEQAMGYMREIMNRIGLTINEAKTKIVKLPQERFDFLGYTLGRFYTKDNTAYIGTRPSKKALKKIIGRIHQETSIGMTWSSAEERIMRLNRVIRGWCNYFNQGPVLKSYSVIQRYTEKRLRRWLAKKHKLRGTTGYRQFSDEYLYEKLGLYKLAERMADVPKAKA